jgi:pimeloyl-ACP methyl ester carboxylesterase
VQVRDLSIPSDGPTLAASLWVPDDPNGVGIVMVGGSGPSDRHNDVLFPPIREHLLARGITVLSYDKRGVGESTGSWVGSTIDDLAADAAAAHDALRQELQIVGLFGHSEGGWVVLRAAASCQELAFVVTNSTPGLTPAVQDRYAVGVAIRGSGATGDVQSSVLAFYDRLTAELRRGASWDEVQPMLRAEPDLKPYFGDMDEDAWRAAGPNLDHDPELDVAGLVCPHLAVFGSADALVPVPESVSAFSTATAARPGEGPPMTIEVFPGADHRLRVGDGFAKGYLATLAAWIERVTGDQLPAKVRA